MERLFIQLSDLNKLTLMTGFVVHGHSDWCSVWFMGHDLNAGNQDRGGRAVLQVCCRNQVWTDAAFTSNQISELLCYYCGRLRWETVHTETLQHTVTQRRPFSECLVFSGGRSEVWVWRFSSTLAGSRSRLRSSRLCLSFRWDQTHICLEDKPLCLD